MKASIHERSVVHAVADTAHILEYNRRCVESLGKREYCRRDSVEYPVDVSFFFVTDAAVYRVLASFLAPPTDVVKSRTFALHGTVVEKSVPFVASVSRFNAVSATLRSLMSTPMTVSASDLSGISTSYCIGTCR